MLRDQLDCLRSIRLALIQCARYDTVPDAVLQSHDLEPGLARCLAKVEHGSDSHGPNLTQLCMATGLILYLSNRRIQSVPLTRLHSALLQQVREACLAAAPSHEACCYGVIAGLLMQASGSHQAALPLQRCLTAALTASIYGQVSCLTPAPPPIAMYSNSIVASFTACVVEAQHEEDLCHLMEPLLHLLKSWCLPEQRSSEPDLPPEARARLQRLIVPLASQILQQLQQTCSSGSQDRMQSQQIQLQHVELKSPKQANRMQSHGNGITADVHACTQPACTNSGAADAALLLAMAYHEPSRAHAPALPQCIAQVLRSLTEGPHSTLLLARRIPSPAQLQVLQHSSGLLNKRIFFSSSNHVVDECIIEEDCLVFVEHLQHTLRKHLLPALQAPGHWKDATKFMMTLLQSCMPQKHVQNSWHMYGGEEKAMAWWNMVIQDLLPILAAQIVSCSGSRKKALELTAALLSSCPECEMKYHLCTQLAALLVMTAVDVSVVSDLSKFMQNVALFCEKPHSVRNVCQLCAILGSKGATTTVACGTAVALMWVIVYADPALVPDVLVMVEGLLSIMDKQAMHTCLAEIRSTLEKCHDCRKKPQCVRWFHRQVHSVAKL